MTIEETNMLTVKAKNRKDGIYAFKGYYWIVKNNQFVAFATPFGQCYHRCGSFNINIGKVERYDRKRQLSEWLKSQDR